MSAAVRIRAIAAGGDGVGTLEDGRTVFVPRSAPGDLVELAEVRLARRFARARIGRMVEAAPGRIPPRCPHYEADDCGSCQLQHLDSSMQRAVRSRVVGDAVRRIGHLPAEDPALEASGSEWEYRTKITLTARGRRIGYHRLGDPGSVFELRHCAIARPELNRLWAACREHRGLLPVGLDQIVFRVDRTGATHILLRTRGEAAWTGAAALGHALAQAGHAAVLWWEPEGGAPRAMFGAAEAYPATVFEQVHPLMGDRVRAFAIELLGELSGRHVWDLYAGIGETTQALLARGATVESVEADARAVAVAETRGPAAGAIRLRARVEDALAGLAPADAAIVNPPRAGLTDAVTRALRSRAPGALIYVSCDPATLARDLGLLAASYRLTMLRAFDLFPQTAHVETVAGLARR